MGAPHTVLSVRDIYEPSSGRPGGRHRPAIGNVLTYVWQPPTESGTVRAMKLAIAGKGGSGKTSISGTMARLLARDGYRVLAIDGDSNPNLALTLGIPAEQMSSMPVLPSTLVAMKAL